MKFFNTISSILALVALCGALSCCSPESVEGPDGGMSGQIAFSTRLAPHTRAAIVGDVVDLAAGGFDVWAIGHSDPWAAGLAKNPLLEEVGVSGEVSGTEVAWNYGTPVQWPRDGFVSFFAYGPSGAASIGTPSAAGTPTLEFEVESSVLQQKDLVVAAPVFDQGPVDYRGGRPVNLMFRHVLSRVVLSATAVDAPDQSIKVESVEISGLYGEGTIDLGAPAPQWSVTGEATAAYTLSVAGGELADVALSSASSALTTPEGCMFLVPQSLSRASGSDVTMRVTLNKGGVREVQSMILFHPEGWLPGKSYDYRLVIEGADVNLVLVSIEDLTLTQWDVEEMIQTVPIVGDQTTDLNRLYSAIDGMVYVKGLDDGISFENCEYFAIYLTPAITGDITIDMERFSAPGMFTTGENLVFDGKKIVGSWAPGATFTVDFDPEVWTLAPSRQNVTDPLDATSGATTLSPSRSITTYGSVILKRR